MTEASEKRVHVWGCWWGWLLWVMALVWQGLGKWSWSDQYVITLTTIPPPIVLLETNPLKIHPIPSSPSTPNTIQRREKKTVKTKKKEERNVRWGFKTWWIPKHKVIFYTPIPFFVLLFSFCHALVICFSRFEVQWKASCCEVILVPPHWLAINEGILTNTFWCPWNGLQKMFWWCLSQIPRFLCL